MKPTEISELAMDRMMQRNQKIAKGLPVKPTPEEVFRKHLDSLVPTREKVSDNERNEKFQAKVRKIMEENASKHPELSNLETSNKESYTKAIEPPKILPSDS